MQAQTTERQPVPVPHMADIHSIARRKERKNRLLYTINAAFIGGEYMAIALLFNGLFQWRLDGFITPAYLLLLGVMLAIYTFLSLNHKLFKIPTPYSWTEEMFRLLRVVGMTFLMTAGLLFLLKVSVMFSRMVIVAFFLGMFVTAWLHRLLKRMLLHLLAVRGVLAKNVLIVGAGKMGRELAEWIGESPYLGYRVVGFLDDFQQGPDIRGKLADFRKVVADWDVDEVFVSIPSQRDFVRELTRQLRNARVSVKIVPELYDLVTTKIALEQVHSIPFLEIAGPQQDMWHRFVKRTIDLLLSVIGLMVFAPVMAVIAVLIKWHSPGPVIFRQQRVGKDGRLFTIYKFRTMVANAEEKLREDPELYRKYVENNYKLEPEDDPRITPLGRFLRKTSLDELPQLWNVVKGDMSMVGPRPVVVEELREYGDKTGDFLSVKPGLTGYWQVRGRSGIGYPDRVDMELYYVYHQSLALDLKILLSTVVSVLKRDGAY